MGERGRAGIRVGVVIDGHHPADRQRLIHRAGEDRNRVDRPTGRHHPACRDAADGRLQPHDIAQPRRHPAGACGVGAKGERHNPRRHRTGRAGGRAARHIGRIEHVARHTIRAAHPHQPGGELVQIGLADQQRPRRQQMRHRRGVVAGRIGKRRTGRRGGQPCHVDIVLHRKRHPPKRATARAFLGQDPGLFADGRV